ncbi:MAG TPA: hypothetical protein VIO94_09720, partial [Phenylobacterium sp.]
TLLLLGAFIPAVTFYLTLLGAPPPLPASAVFPQAITNWLVVWALGNALIAFLLGLWLGPKRGRAKTDWLRAAALAVLVVGLVYAVVALAGVVRVDFRFWVVALKPLSGAQALAALAYAIPFTAFVLVAFRGVTALMVRGDGVGRQYLTAILALALGFAVITGVQYAILFATGALPLDFEALNAIVAIQFVPLLAALAALAVFTWRRTGSYVPGALISGLFVTWYMVAGTATHFAPWELPSLTLT